MRIARTVGFVVMLLAVGVIPASVASASGLLTFYANGEQIPVEPKYSDRFELTTTGPVTISIPALRRSITCPSDPVTASFGWFESNGLAQDKVGTNGYIAGPVRECSGMSLGGLLLDGTLHFSSTGEVRMGWNELLEHSPELDLNNCRFAGDMRATMSLPGPMIITLRGKLHSSQTGCPPLAEVRVGPLEGLYESHLIEGRVSP